MDIDIFTLAHEIKNPLAISKGYLEMSNENNFFKYKNLIESNIDEALTVLNSYLEYNKLQIENEILDLVFLLEEVCDNYKNLFGVNIELKCIYDELYVNGDFYKLKQVFNNLIKNSIEASSKNIKIFIKLINDIISIDVADDGIGINNFNSLKDGYSTKINGNGIGLKITKKIIELHNGTFEYSNNNEIGCNVVIKLPIKL